MGIRSFKGIIKNTGEEDSMRITNRILRKIIKEELAATYLIEQGIFDQPGTGDSEKPAGEEEEETKEGEDVDYSPEEAGVKLPSALKNAMDPKNPTDFAKKDELIDNADNPKHQAAMLAKFALDYTDGDEGTASKILKIATQQGLDTLTKGMKDEGGEGMGEGITRARMQEIIKEEIARHLLGS